MPTNTNNKLNVSTTGGVRGGYVFSAPLGTEGAPTKENYTTWGQSIPAGWENLGYISEDGFTESVSRDDSDALRDLNLDNVDETEGAATETIALTLMEMGHNALAMEYGHKNVTDADGTIEVKHNWGNSGEHRQVVLLLLLKNGRRWTKYIPDGKVSELDDFTGNKTTAAQRQTTIQYNTDEDGTGCYDWIESNETTKPAGAKAAPAFESEE